MIKGFFLETKILMVNMGINWLEFVLYKFLFFSELLFRTLIVAEDVCKLHYIKVYVIIEAID